MTAHFHAGTIRSTRDVTAADSRLKELLFFHLLSRGVYSARRAMFTLSLPLTAADRQGLIDAVADFLDSHAALFTDDRAD
jgi:glutamate-1-semialdehyde 2,1-aminomutase